MSPRYNAPKTAASAWPPARTLLHRWATSITRLQLSLSVIIWIFSRGSSTRRHQFPATHHTLSSMLHRALGIFGKLSPPNLSLQSLHSDVAAPSLETRSKQSLVTSIRRRSPSPFVISTNSPIVFSAAALHKCMIRKTHYHAAGAQRCRSCVRASAAASSLTKPLCRIRTHFAPIVVQSHNPQPTCLIALRFLPHARKSTFGPTQHTPLTSYPASPLSHIFLRFRFRLLLIFLVR